MRRIKTTSDNFTEPSFSDSYSTQDPNLDIHFNKHSNIYGRTSKGVMICYRCHKPGHAKATCHFGRFSNRKYSHTPNTDN